MKKWQTPRYREIVKANLIRKEKQLDNQYILQSRRCQETVD
jgi:hypothetical protein